jgi:UDP-2-acetamido-3-amino-2,3-dideoxy-glucuronate N-acetyltransferase
MSIHIHPTAVIDADVSIGEETRIWHFVHVCSKARIGERCVLGQNVYVGPGVTLGNGVKVQNNVSIYVGVEIEDDVFLGPSCVFTNVRNPRAFLDRKHVFAKTRVRRGASIGANATIVCGNDIGEYALIGAGAIVTKTIPAHSLALGNPAKHRGWMCRCGEKLPSGQRVTCIACDDKYETTPSTCRRMS